MARLAARNGMSVLLVELEERSGPSAVFGHHVLTSDEVELSAGGSGDRAYTVGTDPRSDDHSRRRPGRIPGRPRLCAGRRGAWRSSGMLDVAATAIPGVRDILVLGKIVQLERAHTADLIVVDGPAAGHATTFLTSAQGLLDSSRAGPIHAQAADVVGLLVRPGSVPGRPRDLGGGDPGQRDSRDGVHARRTGSARTSAR